LQDAIDRLERGKPHTALHYQLQLLHFTHQRTVPANRAPSPSIGFPTNEQPNAYNPVDNATRVCSDPHRPRDRTRIHSTDFLIFNLCCYRIPNPL